MQKKLLLIFMKKMSAIDSQRQPSLLYQKKIRICKGHKLTGGLMSIKILKRRRSEGGQDEKQN
ncbi:MAG: hypothetical protein ACETWK_11515 [Candidatus Aminicenantaceae bacterium]